MDERTTIHPSLVRPQQMMGCDRDLYFVLVLAVIVMGGPAGVMDMNFKNVLFAILLWFVGQQGLLYMARKDPYMRQVFNRSVRYRSIYPANSYVNESMPEYKRW